MTFPRHLGVLLTAFMVLGILYSTMTPLFEAPDEQWHFAFIQYLAQGKGLPVQSLPLQHLAEQEGSQPPLYYLLAAALTGWIDTSDYPKVAWKNPHYGYDVPGIVNDNKNLFIHTEQESFPYHNTALAVHLARVLSVLMGAVAVYFTYQLARLLAPEDETVALTSAALVAFLPQFLYISSAASNDSTIAALSALALFLLVRGCCIVPTLRDALLIGLVCGLCALAKVSGIAMLPLALMVLGCIHRRRVPELLKQGLAVCVAFGLTAGWWYARNLILYGELTGTTRMVEIFGARIKPLTIAAWWAQFGEAAQTFWLGFGWGNVRAPDWVYWIPAVAVGAGILGLLLGVWRTRQDLRQSVCRNIPLLILAAWVLIVFAALVRWMMQTQAPYGRLLFPALPALAVLVVTGWEQLLRGRVRALVPRIAAIALFVFALLVPFFFIRPAYLLPESLDGVQVQEIPSRVDVRYDDKLMLLGSRVSPHPLDPRGALQVDLYWRVLGAMDKDYSINLSALDENYHVVGARNSYHGHGTLPTTRMTPGQTFHDTYWLPVRAPAGSIQVSVYELSTQQNLTPFDPAGNEITPIVNRFELVH